MKVFKFACCLMGVLLLGPRLPGAQSALEIMREQEKRHRSTTEYSRFTMELLDAKGSRREREVHLWISRQPGDGTVRALLKFAAPSDIRNTGLLTWEQPGDKEDDQWLYLPATKTAKRITGGGKKQPFMGSDLAFEDMRPENLDVHDYSITGTAKVEGAACWIIQAVPSTAREKRDSGYTRRLLWIRQDRYTTVKSEFYARGDKLVKTGEYSGWKQAGEGLWRASVGRVHRPSSGTTTILRTLERRIGAPMDASLFTQQALTRPLVVP
jgi:Outer membrane lipoprotein-sorting protein